MKKHIILLLLSVICNIAYAEKPDLIKEMNENYLLMRQKPGTADLMKQYLSKVDSKSDTIYAIIYAPMNCPRCETYIRAFQKELKHNDLNNELLLISIYPDSLLAKNYNTKNKYVADNYIYDTNKSYAKMLSFNSAGIYSTIIMKICKSSGRLIAGGDPTEISKEFITQFKALKKPTDYAVFENESDNELAINPTLNIADIKTKYYDYSVTQDSSTLISTVYDLPKFENNSFFYSDVLNNGAMLFSVDNKKKNIKFKTLLQADSIEKRMYVKVSEKNYNQFINSGSVFYIACGASTLSNNKIGISYSLPNLFYEASQDTNIIRIGYRNEAAIVTRNATTLEKDSISSFDFEVEKNDFFYAHYTFNSYDDNIIIGCKKYTWPLEFEAHEYKDEIHRNSFHDGFYDTDNPFMAVFSRKTGKLVERFGQMEESQRKSRTGYFFVKSISCTLDDNILYGNGYSGQLYLCSKSNLKENLNHYSAFEIDVNKFPPVDSTLFYTYEYVKPYNQFFTKCIESIKMNNTHIYCLVRYGLPKNSNNPLDYYSLITINRKSGKKTEALLPKYSTLEALGYGLMEEKKGEIKPFAFLKKGTKAIVRVFK